MLQTHKKRFIDCSLIDWPVKGEFVGEETTKTSNPNVLLANQFSFLNLISAAASFCCATSIGQKKEEK